jgi:F-type H+-transporting ATPase subunit alpha
MAKGRDVLIVYDDLTQHARAYREISLLLRRPPGREAFPGDIFYIHSRMLERSTHLNKALGGGSLTALPIIETEAEDIAAYIPTNLISITDGQLGVLPAVNVGKSVSRVGGNAQHAILRGVASDIKLAYAQFEELETFARFGARLDAATAKTLAHGRRIRAALKQNEMAPLSVQQQIGILLALGAGLFDPVPLARMDEAQGAIVTAVDALPAALLDRLSGTGKLEDADRAAVMAMLQTALAPFVAPADAAKPPSGEADPAVDPTPAR